MDRREVTELVQDSVNSAIGHSKNEILTGVQLLISSEMKKVTENQRALADMQISKIADLSCHPTTTSKGVQMRNNFR